MIHTVRKILLNLVQKSPFEDLIKDFVLFVSTGKGASYDKETFDVMRKVLVRDSNCIDIGAYRGDILRRIVKFAPLGEIYAIEPVPENFEYLRKKYPGVHLFNTALSNEVGKATFFHVRGRPARSGLEKQDYPDPNEQVDEIEVSLNTLDNLIPGQTAIAFIKVDVEGAELKVLQGGIELIRKWRPVIVFEHAEEASLKFNATSEELRAFLVDDCGLQVSTMGRWLKSEQALTKEEFHDARLQQKEMYFIAYPSLG